jgi:myo-inositol-1(or 4)-monophosphatase
LNQTINLEKNKLAEWVEQLHLSSDLEIALNAAIKAASCIEIELAKRNGVISFNDKQALKGIVTEFDKLAEQEIRRVLASATNYSFLGEEEGLVGTTASTKQWVVDPIDGTTNFAFGYSFCAISIALKHNDEFILGVVYELRTGDIFFAEKDKGAYKNGKQIKVSPPERYGNQPVIFSIMDILLILKSVQVLSLQG